VYTGTINVASTTSSSTGVPEGATVTCFLEENGAEIPATRMVVAGGNGAQNGSQQIQFSADWLSDTVSLCRQVFYDDGETGGDWLTCVPGTWQASGLSFSAQN
jgi:hypothetical protein